MNYGAVEEEDDIISSSSGSFSSSPSDRQRLKEQSLHSPLSLATSTTTCSLSIDLNHHSPASNSSPCNFLLKQLEAPSGLNLLVAALDAQDPCAFRRQQQDDTSQAQFEHPLIVDEDSYFHQHPTSDDDTGSEKRSSRRKSTIPDTSKDETYWEKRKRNNEAAKRSREKRRINDMAVEARLMELSRENSLLKNELDSVRKRQLPTPNPANLLVPTTPDIPSVVHSSPDIAAQIGALSPHQTSIATSVAHFASLGAPRSPFIPNAAGFVNPLLAMVPPAMLLQAIAQQQHHHPSMSPPVSLGVGGKRFNPFSTADGSGLRDHQNHSSAQLSGSEHRQTPTIPSVLSAALSAPTSPGPPTASSFSDGKQYLRYKLLERQLQQQNIGALAAPSHGLNLLGSVISGAGNGLKAPQRSSSMTNSSFQPPPTKRQRTAPIATKATVAELIRADADTSLSLKECLSSLAVSLASPGALPSPTISNGEKAGNGCDSSLSTTGTSSISRASIHSSPSANDDNHQNGNQDRSSILFDDGIARIGDLLRARTHSDSSQSSAGISSHGSSTSTTASTMGTGAISPNTIMEMEFRNSLSDRRRDSNNSDSGMVSDGASDRRMTPGSCGKRYRSDHERYMERRRRNNEAAKRCRANRRAMFEYRYQRAQELENENARLKDEMRQLNRELNELKEMLAKRGDLLANASELVLQTVNKNRETLESVRLKNLINTNDLEEHRASQLSIADDMKEEDSEDESREIDSPDGRSTDEIPLDFTVKKEKI